MYRCAEIKTKQNKFFFISNALFRFAQRERLSQNVIFIAIRSQQMQNTEHLILFRILSVHLHHRRRFVEISSAMASDRNRSYQFV